MRQTRDLESRSATQDSALKKCHHIIQTMRDAIEREKERRVSTESKVSALENTLAEKVTLIEQMKGATMVLEEKLRSAHLEKNTSSEQLKEAHAKLHQCASQLAERDTMLVYLNKQLNNVGLQGGVSGLRTAVPPSGSALYNAFSKGATAASLADWKGSDLTTTGLSGMAPSTPPVTSKSVFAGLNRSTTVPTGTTTTYHSYTQQSRTPTSSPHTSTYVAVGVESTTLQPSAYFPLTSSS